MVILVAKLVDNVAQIAARMGIASIRSGWNDYAMGRNR